MKHVFLAILLFVFSGSLKSQYDKEFYLIDSLQLQEGTVIQKQLDSVLTLYHKSDNDLEKIQLLNSLFLESLSNPLIDSYNSFIRKKIKIKKFFWKK